MQPTVIKNIYKKKKNRKTKLNRKSNALYTYRNNDLTESYVYLVDNLTGEKRTYHKQMTS